MIDTNFLINLLYILILVITILLILTFLRILKKKDNKPEVLRKKR